MSKTEKLAPVDFLISVYHLRSRAGLVGPVLIYNHWVYHVYLRHCTSVCWHTKNPAWVWTSYSRSDNQLSYI